MGMMLEKGRYFQGLF